MAMNYVVGTCSKCWKVRLYYANVINIGNYFKLRLKFWMKPDIVGCDRD